MQNFWSTLKKPIIGLAPMDGVTDFPMRQIQASIKKPNVIYTEFISVEGYARKPEKFQKQLTFKENERPIVAQVFGSEPKDFIKACEKISLLGFDGIDINMGCPSKSIVNRGGGAALINNKKLTEKIISACLKGISISERSIPLSVKTRIGKDKIVTVEWLKFLTQFPLSEITLHGRLLNQVHSGPVNWGEITLAALICHEKNIILLGNGGVKTLDEAKEKSKKFGLDGVLIGQAALGNPWVFKEDFRHTNEELFKTILRHSQLAFDFYGEKSFISVRKHLGWYSRNLPNAKKLRINLLQTKTPQEIKKILCLA